MIGFWGLKRICWNPQAKFKEKKISFFKVDSNYRFSPIVYYDGRVQKANNDWNINSIS
jgi:hypothetical protein